MSDINRIGAAANQPAGAPDIEPSNAAKAVALAQQFESMLLSQMLREMRILESDDESSGFGSSIMNDTMRTEFAMALSKTGGMGIASSLSEAFARVGAQDDARQLEGTDAPAAESVVVPALTDPAALTLPDAKVTSSFGWRTDPLNGQQRFHHGTDLRMAYGQDVRSAGGGIVKSVGDAGGYGLMVAIDHGDGLETRYAHLSGVSVRPGETIAAGQVIARSGNSGRSTGPHLHFEVREAGQPVDPSRYAGRLAVTAE
jgi:murein DD-endopeptidase MepM/ murein hydrolase activator NlpD